MQREKGGVCLCVTVFLNNANIETLDIVLKHHCLTLLRTSLLEQKKKGLDTL